MSLKSSRFAWLASVAAALAPIACSGALAIIGLSTPSELSSLSMKRYGPGRSSPLPPSRLAVSVWLGTADHGHSWRASGLSIEADMAGRA